MNEELFFFLLPADNRSKEIRGAEKWQTLEHRSVGTVRDSEYVRRHFVSLYSLVALHDFLGVYRQLLVRIHDDEKQAGICLRREIHDINQKLASEN